MIEEHRDTLSIIVRLRKDGMHYRAIARKLNEAGVQTRTSEQWTAHLVRSASLVAQQSANGVEPTRSRLADQLRDAIRQSGRTLAHVALQTGVSIWLLQRFMKAERDLPLTLFERLCAAVDLSPNPPDLSMTPELVEALAHREPLPEAVRFVLRVLGIQHKSLAAEIGLSEGHFLAALNGRANWIPVAPRVGQAFRKRLLAAEAGKRVAS
jgi:hypothetical protein